MVIITVWWPTQRERCGNNIVNHNSEDITKQVNVMKQEGGVFTVKKVLEYLPFKGVIWKVEREIGQHYSSVLYKRRRLPLLQQGPIVSHTKVRALKLLPDFTEGFLQTLEALFLIRTFLFLYVCSIAMCYYFVLLDF